MANDEPKKKILTIVRGAMLEADELPFVETTEYVADALIAAGIGDVKEAERKAFVYSEEIVHLDKKLKESEHRAARAERALLIACGNITKELWQDKFAWRTRNYYDDMIQQAEKELVEEEKDGNI